MNVWNVLKRGELTQPWVQLSKPESVFQVLEFLQLSGKPGHHQQVYHPKVLGWVVVPAEDVGGGNEVGVPVNRTLRSQDGIILVDLERCPLKLPEVIAESSPGPDAIKRAKEDDAK